MTFRDFAQGAFRMRGIGHGQTIELLLISEMETLINVQVAAGSGKNLTPGDLEALTKEQEQGSSSFV